MASQSRFRNFRLAYRFDGHLAAHPADLALHPPASYLYIQDILVLFSAFSWVLAYIFSAVRIFRDGRSCIPIYVFPLNLCWEMVYWMRLGTTQFERISFSGWFFADLAFIIVACHHASGGQGTRLAVKLALWTAPCFAIFWYLSEYWTDHQKTGYFFGNTITVLICSGKLYDLTIRKEPKGHSIEIWLMHFLGTNVFGFGVFFWRYANVPQNWSYVIEWPSIVLIVTSTLANLIYPLVYRRIILVEAFSKTKSA